MWMDAARTRDTGHGVNGYEIPKEKSFLTEAGAMPMDRDHKRVYDSIFYLGKAI